MPTSKKLLYRILPPKKSISEYVTDENHQHWHYFRVPRTRCFVKICNCITAVYCPLKMYVLNWFCNWNKRNYSSIHSFSQIGSILRLSEASHFGKPTLKANKSFEKRAFNALKTGIPFEMYIFRHLRWKKNSTFLSVCNL